MYYKIAGLFVEMNPIYEPLINQVDEYKIDYIPEVIDCDIPQGEKQILRYHGKHPELTIGECEYLLYGAFFYDTLLDHQGIFLHASCVVYEGNAYLFSAPSGTGKSTHTQNWLKAFPGAFILNDDKPAIRIEDNIIYAYGTPFSGKTNQNINSRYPIKGIAFLERDSKNFIYELSIKDAIPKFLSQTMLPHNEKRIDQMVKILSEILFNVPIYEFKLNMDLESAQVAYKKMS